MAYKGSRTKTTAIWLAPEDEVRVGRAIADAAPRAAWLCSPPGPAALHPVHLHRNLEQAFECGPTRPARLLGPGGRVSTAGRIGQAAYDMVTTTGIPLTRGGPERCALA